VLRNISRDFNSEDAKTKTFTTHATFLKVYSSMYVTLPSNIDPQLGAFVRKFALNSAIALSGELVERIFEKCKSGDQKLPIINGRAFLNICESLESASLRQVETWQSACLFRKQCLLVVWTGQIDGLSAWVGEIDGYLRQVVCLFASRPQVYFDKHFKVNPRPSSALLVADSGTQDISLFSNVGPNDDTIERTQSRHPTYGDAYVMGCGVMSVTIILIGVLGKKVN
jgi:hypothetical protein